MNANGYEGMGKYKVMTMAMLFSGICVGLKLVGGKAENLGK